MTDLDAPTSAHPSATTLSTDADDGVFGLDNVRLDLPIAGIGSRTLAILIDTILQSLLMLVWALLWAAGIAFLEIGMTWAIVVLMLGAFALQWSYFAVCEIAMDGRTPGKSVLGLRTVSHLGGRPSIGAFVIRNVLRSLDMVIGIPMMWLDRRSRRLGDLVASTLVVHDRPLDPFGLARMPASFGPREISTVEAFLHRAGRMEPTLAENQATTLVAWLQRTEPEFVASAPAGPQLGEVGESRQPNLELLRGWLLTPRQEIKHDLSTHDLSTQDVDGAAEAGA